MESSEIGFVGDKPPYIISTADDSPIDPTATYYVVKLSPGEEFDRSKAVRAHAVRAGDPALAAVA